MSSQGKIGAKNRKKKIKKFQIPLNYSRSPPIENFGEIYKNDNKTPSLQIESSHQHTKDPVFSKDEISQSGNETETVASQNELINQNISNNFKHPLIINLNLPNNYILRIPIEEGPNKFDNLKKKLNEMKLNSDLIESIVYFSEKAIINEKFLAK